MLIGDVDWYPMTPVSLIESAEPSFSLAFGEGYPEVRILKDFKFKHFGSADSKRVTGAFFVSADSGRLRVLGREMTKQRNSEAIR